MLNNDGHNNTTNNPNNSFKNKRITKHYANENDKFNNENINNQADGTEIASNTCFSSEQEVKYKNKESKLANSIKKIGTAFKKSFLPPEAEKKSRFADLRDRGIWTIIMLLAFMGLIYLGNFYCAVLVLFIIMAIYSELINIETYIERNKETKFYYFLAWYFFFFCIYFFYVRQLQDKLIYLRSFKIVSELLKYHNLISFFLYIIGFIVFIFSLTKGYYKYQFRSFAWIHILLLIFGISSSMIISNIFNGLIWFILPASMVICNDISAYVFGRLFGKTPLSSLSPKKTVEGFVGGVFSTMIFGYFLAEFILNYEFLMCPMKEITWKVVRLDCDTSDFRRDSSFHFELPYIGKFIIPFVNMHFHTISLGIFASLLAPLGGLFASGFKRALKIKDFANVIPGHGGITDRMDCQILMGFFTYVWTHQFIFVSEGKKFNQIMNSINSLAYDDRMRIFTYLNNTLFNY